MMLDNGAVPEHIRETEQFGDGLEEPPRADGLLGHVESFKWFFHGLRFVPPRRIERLSSEPESEILSIKLQGRFKGLQIYHLFLLYL